MVAVSLISARVTAARKAQFAALAHQQGLTESALLKRLVNAALIASEVVQLDVIEPVERAAATGKISVRLNPDDLLLLRERADARCVPTATYVSFLIRSHLRSLAPLLPNELAVLKASIAELGAIGRNMNQIAHALNRGEHPHGPNIGDLRAVMRALAALRDSFKAVIVANLTGWNLGHEKNR
ncbi:MAG: plasmid mobilization relaxosome protein MobC [Proteobacteria bacterium]|nr:plasmid mobilization relaxosome protein MobC [Pseudomonadota bacterium]